MKNTFALIRNFSKDHINARRGFTLIELLVVISIIGVLIALSVFGLQGARRSARDSQRKTDLEEIRSGLEIYKADCNVYPTSLTQGGSLTGTDATCSPTGSTYINEVPEDPVPSQNYFYVSDGLVYTLCASLEQGSASSDTAGCGSCGESCNYKVTNP